MSHMLARECETRRRSVANPSGLFIPAIIHDGPDFSRKLNQPHNISTLASHASEQYRRPRVVKCTNLIWTDLAHIQYLEIQKYFNVRMPIYCRLAAQLNAILRCEVTAIAEAIKAAPPWRPERPEQAA